MLGHQAFFRVEATKHHPNEFVLLVGDTAKAKKGSSFDHVARLLTDAHPSFPSRVTTGLSSGEGLIWAVRDPHEQDPGAQDKRLLVVEPEFASVLKATSREISTLSPTLRSAWDGRPLALLTRTAPATATSAHIAIIGHITQTELARHTTTVELANGFLNRFLICACRRVRLLPEGGDPEPLKGTGLQQYLAAVLQHADTHRQVTLAPDARELWWHAYPQLTQPLDGLAGHITARAEAHTIRLALLYALLDSTPPDPLRASPRRARALGLHLPLRPLGAQPSDRRPARRAAPRRVDPRPRRPHPHPTLPPRAPQPPRRATRPSPANAHRHRPRPAHQDQHRRPPRRTLARQPPRLNPRAPRYWGKRGAFEGLAR